MRAGRATGLLAAFGLALGSGLAAAWLLAPQEMRQGMLDRLGGSAPPPKPAAGGWGAATAAPEPAPLIDLAALGWMAWTPQTGAFFLFILLCLSLMTGLEIARPGGAPRRGVLGLDTTRGDRLFISLLGTAWILLGWLGIIGMPLWGGVGLAVLWAAFVFRWV